MHLSLDQTRNAANTTMNGDPPQQETCEGSVHIVPKLLERLDQSQGECQTSFGNIWASGHMLAMIIAK